MTTKERSLVFDVNRRNEQKPRMKIRQMQQYSHRNQQKLLGQDFSNMEQLASQIIAMIERIGEDIIDPVESEDYLAITKFEMDVIPDTFKINTEQKSASKKRFIVAELIQTEKTYVRDLGECIDIFTWEMLTNKSPPGISKMQHVIFGNLLEIYEFHQNIFLKELEKYEHMPEEIGHCFLTWAGKFQLYVDYCKNHPRSSKLIMEHSRNYFDKIQQKYQLPNTITSYLLKPVKRILQYPLLLKNLLESCESNSVLQEAVEVMLSIPKAINDAMHLSSVDGFDESIKEELLMEESFKVWDSKSPFRMGRKRYLFLLEKTLVFCKVAKGTKGKFKYIFKRQFNLSEIKMIENVEGKPRKFALLMGCTLNNIIVLKAPTIKIKLEWIGHIRKLIHEQTNFLGAGLKKPLYIPKFSTATLCKHQRGEEHLRVNVKAVNYSGPEQLDEPASNKIGDCHEMTPNLNLASRNRCILKVNQPNKEHSEKKKVAFKLI
ncbi:triple functional domain protein-like [Stigmatopora nigra]